MNKNISSIYKYNYNYHAMPIHLITQKILHNTYIKYCRGYNSSLFLSGFLKPIKSSKLVLATLFFPNIALILEINLGNIKIIPYTYFSL